jgi:amidohydrolase
MGLDSNFLEEIVNFRKQLHSFPELSGNEKNTSNSVALILAKTKPSELIRNIGGYGIAAIYDSGKPGPTILFRADLDALPIQESNTFTYRSKNDGIAHLCGHDGHSAILVGMARVLDKERPKKGRVVLLFQPAEETGQGAKMVINDNLFLKIMPDFVFALHNLPGFEKGSVCIKDGSFASASTGVIIQLKGLSSHAAHPEDGKNPDLLLADLIIQLNEINNSKNLVKDFALLTVIHARLGEQAFGTSPGNAVLMATIRASRNEDMLRIREQIEKTVEQNSNAFKIKYAISYTEEFPATVNNAKCTEIIMKAALANSIPVKTLASPFRWSEDFGHFTQSYNAALFGIGSGIGHPQLHNEHYDFPDEIIEPAILIYKEILKELGVL